MLSPYRSEAYSDFSDAVIARKYGVALEGVEPKQRERQPRRRKGNEISPGPRLRLEDVRNVDVRCVHGTNRIPRTRPLPSGLQPNRFSCSVSKRADGASTPGNPRGLEPAARHTRTNFALGGSVFAS